MFSPSVLSVGMEAGQNFHFVKLIHKTLCELGKCLGVLGSPPVDHVALGIEVTALVVKSVSHFMSDHHAYTAVVLGIARLGSKKGA